MNKKHNFKWLRVLDNKISYLEEAYGFTPADYLFKSWKIEGTNPVVIEGITPENTKKKVKIYNPIMEIID